ncbi:MAG: hypothetical protein K8F91_03010, partial [Candidatus Obscuribacterales bacterium]|nr:hypothetical protein [Candidatus Obscuribacterales bacterium]
ALEEVLSDSTYGVMDDTWEIEESKADRLVARLNFMDSSSHSGGRVERELLLRFDVIEPMPKLVRVQFEFRPYPLSVDYGSLADIIFELQEDLSESLGGQTGESFGRIRQVRILPPAWLMSSTVLLLILYCVEVVGIS